MRGIYRFYQNGELIATAENLITTEGKRLILRYLAGLAPNIGEVLAVGVSGVAANVADSALTFEIDRATISLKSPNYTTNQVIFKGTLPQEAIYKIYEVGLYSQASNSLAGEFASRILTTFDTSIENWTNVTVDTTQQRTSVDAVRVDVGASATVNIRAPAILDLSGYTFNDEFKLGFYKSTNNITNVTLVFENQGGATLTRTIAVNALPTGYNVIAFKKGDFTGTATWNAITSYGLNIQANATGGFLILDGIRVEDTDTPNLDYILVSHAVLGAPLSKDATAPYDVEYALEFTVT
jgi:hypothetical protein